MCKLRVSLTNSHLVSEISLPAAGTMLGDCGSVRSWGLGGRRLQSSGLGRFWFLLQGEVSSLGHVLPLLCLACYDGLKL